MTCSCGDVWAKKSSRSFFSHVVYRFLSTALLQMLGVNCLSKPPCLSLHPRSQSCGRWLRRSFLSTNWCCFSAFGLMNFSLLCDSVSCESWSMTTSCPHTKVDLLNQLPHGMTRFDWLKDNGPLWAARPPTGQIYNMGSLELPNEFVPNHLRSCCKHMLFCSTLKCTFECEGACLTPTVSSLVCLQPAVLSTHSAASARAA